MKMPLVTVGIPVYKRLRFLPEAVQSVAAQDYQNIELIVSDNGVNGTAIPELVGKYYTRPYRFRQNPSTINATLHYNQIVHEATGDYVVLLGDDDEISPNFVSDLVGVVQRHPDITVAIPKQELIDEEGRTFRASADSVQELLSGKEFIRSWCRGTYGWLTFSTVLMKTSEVRRCGGFVVIPTGNGDEDALLIKMALNHSLGASARSTVRKRAYPTSLGYSCSYPELTDAARHFIRFLDTDEMLRDYAKRNSGQWRELRGLIVEMLWKMCYGRWKDLYRSRLSSLQWAAVSLSMPWIPAYYRIVGRTLWEEYKFAVLTNLKSRFPWIKKVCQVFRIRLDNVKRRLMRRSEGKDILLQRYVRVHGKHLNLTNPQNFTEKLFCRMISLNRKNNHEFTRLSDKYTARAYVGSKVGEQHLVKLLWHGKDPSAIPFDTLPAEYVIKTNHGSGQIIVVKGKADRIDVISRLSGWLKSNYYWSYREYQYYHIKPRVMIEEYLRNQDGSEPLDYKFWCFKGIPEVIHVDNPARDINPFFDTQWNQLDLYYREGASRPAIAKPINFEQMISIASRLSAGFDFVRVDLYNLDGKIYFGEFTFTHTAGQSKLRPESWDLKLGEKWEMET